LDLQNMTWAELVAWWNLWLEQAQITNGMDRDEYAHGVFRYGPLTEDVTTPDDERRRTRRTTDCDVGEG